ncbi:MAG: uracil-DNA glycosylase [Thermodesulfobacteriota bacterium]
MDETFTQIERSLRFLSHLGSTGFDCSENSINRLYTPLHETLGDIESDLGECRRCRLSKTRSRIVFGTGPSTARLIFIGEGPGYEEDMQGKPFVGAAGQLLTKIIQAMGMSRDGVYVCNVVKCRPPENRAPLPDEIAECLPFLWRQIRSIGPSHICALGAVASQTLLKVETPISRLRGRFHEIDGMRIIPTYHPAYLLRNPDKKKEVWEDMKRLISEMQENDHAPGS